MAERASELSGFSFMNEIISQLFVYKKEVAKRDETNSVLMSENHSLRQQIDQFKA